MAGHEEQALPFSFLLQTFSFPKTPESHRPVDPYLVLSQACRLVGKVTNTRHPSRRGGYCHNGILSENLASRHFFQNQLTLNIVALLYNCYGMCKCILFTGYPPILEKKLALPFPPLCDSQESSRWSFWNPPQSWSCEIGSRDLEGYWRGTTNKRSKNRSHVIHMIFKYQSYCSARLKIFW